MRSCRLVNPEQLPGASNYFQSGTETDDMDIESETAQFSGSPTVIVGEHDLTSSGMGSSPENGRVDMEVCPERVLKRNRNSSPEREEVVVKRGKPDMPTVDIVELVDKLVEFLRLW